MNSSLFSNVDIIAAESERHSKDEVSAFKDTYGNDKMIFSYCEDWDNSSSLWAYARKLEMGNTISYPVMIHIDKNNKIQYGTTGVSDADTVAANLERYCTAAEDTSM